MHIAYAAGFFDGEGCVVIARRVKKQQKTPEYVVVVTIGQKVRAPLDALQAQFGGAIYANKAQGSWFWTVCSTRASAFLIKIRRFLIVKRRQADLVLKFQRHLSKRVKVTPRELEKREIVRLQLKALKRPWLEPTPAI